MPFYNFGRKTDKPQELIESPDLIAVRTKSHRTLGAGAVGLAHPAVDEIRDGRLVVAFPDVGVEVYRVPESASKTQSSRLSALRDHPDVRFAGAVLVDPDSGEPVIYTENIFVKFVDTAEPEKCETALKDAELTITSRPEYATNAFTVAPRAGVGQRVFDIANRLLEKDDVEFAHPELVRARSFKFVAQDQWHLQATTINGRIVNAHANVAAAHQISRGQGVRIAVIDDAFDTGHLEFNTTGKLVYPYDTGSATLDPRPRSARENHGTACAGVACANGNHGACGVAPDAALMPIRVSNALGSLQEAAAFRWAVQHGADVISCSWGPPDGRWWDPNDPVHNAVAPLPAHTRLAIEDAARNGRGGKGCVILFAAGNGNESVDNDGYASHSDVIAVAACNDSSTRCVYSDYGKAIWCSFPSGDTAHPPIGHPAPLTRGIWTIDRSGPDGYNDGRNGEGDRAGHYVATFTGTSSSCPGAAGIAALILSVNPQLTAVDARRILKDCCDKIDLAGGGYDSAGRSDKYGFGRLNALVAVQLAQP